MKLAGTQLEIFEELNEIAGPCERLRLEPQAMAVLVLLAAEPERVWSRDELLDAAWPGKVVSDATLTGVISRLRRAIGQAGTQGVRIETRSKRGYRLVIAKNDEPALASRRKRWSMAGSLGVMLIVGSALFLLSAGSPLKGVSLAFDITLPNGEHVAPLIWLEAESEGTISSEGIDIRIVPYPRKDGLVRLEFQASNLSHWASFDHVLAVNEENQFTLADPEGGRPYQVKFRLQRGEPPEMRALKAGK